MNREIKFSGKRVDNGQWVYGFVVINKDGTAWIKSTDYNVNNNRIDVIPYQVLPETVGQYTGLKDKDGNEIYEGDVIGGYPHGSVYVQYNSDWGCFESRNIDAELNELNGLFANDLKDCFNEWSVIGNIHDNPELIK